MVGWFLLGIFGWVAPVYLLDILRQLRNAIHAMLTFDFQFTLWHFLCVYGAMDTSIECSSPHKTQKKEKRETWEWSSS